MKSFTVALCVATMLAAGSLWHHSYVSKTTEKIVRKAELVAENIENGNFSEAGLSAESLLETVVGEEGMLGVICDHKEYYEIKGEIAELVAFIGVEDEGESLAHCATIISLTERISEISKPYISNIL